MHFFQGFIFTKTLIACRAIQLRFLNEDTLLNNACRRSKKKKTCLASPPASFFEAACFFLLLFYLKKLLKKQRKILSFSIFFFFFFIIIFFLLPFFFRRIMNPALNKLMSYLESKWGPLKKKKTGGHLEKIGRPVVLENVSGGHFEKKKKKRASSFLFSTEAGR